jgi:hypothetical protein
MTMHACMLRVMSSAFSGLHYFRQHSAVLRYYFSANKYCFSYTTNQHNDQHKLNFSEMNSQIPAVSPSYPTEYAVVKSHRMHSSRHLSFFLSAKTYYSSTVLAS